MPHESTLPAVFSNLSKAAEKQQDYQTAERFATLAHERTTGLLEAGPTGDATLESLRTQLAADIESSYPGIESAGTAAGDRGALRAATWGKKATTAQRSLIDRYLAKGEELIEGTNLYVCEACGFIFAGDDTPPLCPVCKAPSRRFTKVK